MIQDTLQTTPPAASPAPTEESPEVRKQKYLQDLCLQYVRIPMAIMLDLQSGALNYSDITVYLYLLAKQGENEMLWWSTENLTLLTDIDATTIKRSFRRLSECGHIRRERRVPNSRTFCLTKVQSEAKETRIFVKNEARVIIGKTS